MENFTSVPCRQSGEVHEEPAQQPKETPSSLRRAFLESTTGERDDGEFLSLEAVAPES